MQSTTGVRRIGAAVRGCAGARVLLYLHRRMSFRLFFVAIRASGPLRSLKTACQHTTLHTAACLVLAPSSTRSADRCSAESDRCERKSPAMVEEGYTWWFKHYSAVQVEVLVVRARVRVGTL